MKTEEDEAFDDLAKRQGSWGGGFPAKRKMVADKLQELVPSDAFERWWYYEGSAPPYTHHDCEEHTKRMCKIAWSNGADVAAQPAQEPVAFICQGNLYMAGDVDKYCTATHIPLYFAPPQRPWIWLSDADIREAIDSICQYSGDYDEWLCKKIERKIRGMNT
jgi:hypothetical protein